MGNGRGTSARIGNEHKLQIKRNRGALPIFFVKPWELWCLLDTGSDSTIFSKEAAEKVGNSRGMSECKCKIVTVAGVKPLVGEVRVDFKCLVGEDLQLCVHVAEIPSTRYDVILGCDIMEKVKSYSSTRNGKWRIILGRKKYQAGRMIQKKGHITVGSMHREEEEVESIAERVMSGFKGVFYVDGEPLTATGRVRHGIELDSDKPVYVKPRRYPQTMKDIIKKQIGEMLEQGIIQKSTSPYCSPLWVVPKSTQAGQEPKYRVVVDFRELNRRTQLERYPLPRLEDMLDRMAGAKIFSTFDLKAGYHQIRMEPKDVEKTAFSFERGHYEFLRMPFGLKNAPATFQRLMDEFLEGLDENAVQVYMDDIVVFSPDRESHMKHLTQFMKRVKEFGLKISIEKSNLGQTEVKFMGHTISEKGVRPNGDKVVAIQAMPTPRNVKEVRTFLGMMGYYRKFVENLAEMTEPLTALLKKGSKFTVSPAVVDSVQKCKDALCSAPVLGFPDFGKLFVLTTDASQEAVGAVLSQPAPNGDQPIAYGSKKLSAAERRYSTIERELLGIVWGVEHFRPYLFGRFFVIKTDHMPLLWVEKLKETSARITKWKEKLAVYEFNIVHTKGKDNVVADCLSRNINCMEGHAEGSPGEQPFALRYLSEWANQGPELAPAWRHPDEARQGANGMGPPGISSQRETAGPSGGDQETRTMECQDGMINDKRDQLLLERARSTGSETAFHRYGHLKITTVRLRDEASDEEWEHLLNQVISRGKTYYFYCKTDAMRERMKRLYEARKVAAESTLIECKRKVETIEENDQQNEVVRNYHVGKTNHRGIQETVEHLKRTYYWIAMPEMVKKVIEHCTTCNRAKYDRAPHVTPQMKTPTPTTPMDTLQIDTFYYQGDKYLTIIDTFSRLAYTHHLRNKSAKDILDGLLNFLGTFGCPREIVADRGREFHNEKVKRVLGELGIEMRFTTVGHQRSHGQIERLHSTLTEHLHLLDIARNIKGTEAMARAVLAYNDSIHSATGHTPLALMFRRMDETATRSSEERQAEVASREEKKKVTRTRIINNKKGEDITKLIRVGSEVFKKNFYKRKKTDSRFLGPYRVVQLMSRNRVLIVRSEHPEKRKEIVHLNEIKLPNRRGRKKVKVCERVLLNSDDSGE